MERGGNVLWLGISGVAVVQNRDTSLKHFRSVMGIPKVETQGELIQKPIRPTREIRNRLRIRKRSFREDGWAADSVGSLKRCIWCVHGRLFCTPADWRPREREVVDACETSQARLRKDLDLNPKGKAADQSCNTEKRQSMANLRDPQNWRDREVTDLTSFCKVVACIWMSG